jgi:uncharacterized protein (DUF488 family)
MDPTTNPIFTIGHSNHSLDAFVALLEQHGISALADVRSAPYSRFNPQFNKPALERALKKHNIRYVFLGRELGARSEDRSCYENGRVRYPLLARTELFRQGIERVIRGSKDFRIALVCAEKEPLDCHRTLLVARALDDLGLEIQHIHADGHLEAHRDAMLRLLDLVDIPREDLFRSLQVLLSEALAKQEMKVAYIDEQMTAETSAA